MWTSPFNAVVATPVVTVITAPGPKHPRYGIGTPALTAVVESAFDTALPALAIPAVGYRVA